MSKLETSDERHESLRDWLQSLADGPLLAETAARLRAASGGPASARYGAETVADLIWPGERSRSKLERLCDDSRLRRQVASAARSLAVAERTRGSSKARWLGHRWLGAVALMAASIAGILVVPRLHDTGAVRESHRSDTITIADVQVIGEGGELAAAPFVEWKPVVGADLYEVEVTAADGRMVYRERTEDTALQVPADLLTPGVPYFYRVRARLEITRWIASDFQEFVVRP